MISIRLAAIGVAIVLAPAPAFAANFMRGEVATNASALLGDPLTTKPDRRGLFAHTDVVDRGDFSVPESRADMRVGLDEIEARNQVSATWDSPDKGHIATFSAVTVSLPDSGPRLAMAGTFDFSNSHPAWDYQFSTTPDDRVFHMAFSIASFGGAEGLGRWDVAVLKDGATVGFAELARLDPTVGFSQALVAGHQYEVRLESNDFINLVAPNIRDLFASDTALFDWTIGRSATAGGGTGGPGGAGGAPEPSAWALAIVGFGLTGAALRRKRTPAPA